MTLACSTARHLRQNALLRTWGGRTPRYTSYPTAAQFTAEVGPEDYAAWLGDLDPRRAVSVYVHVPFCARLCWYCGCNTRVVNRGERIADYVALLADELSMVEARLPARLDAAAIHLGGGTPNMLGVGELDALFGVLRQVFRVVDDAEIAAEIDPSQLSPEWVTAAASHGLSRASIGVQDLSPDVQAAVNRHESFEVVAQAASLLRDAGVASLNFDVMYGLPRQRAADVLSTIDKLMTLRPDRLALFGYAHVPWMKPHQKLIDERELPGDAERLEQSEAAADRLSAAGYVRLGLDHYALPDDPLAQAFAGGELHRNFQGYTTDGAETLLGFGVSAIGRLPQGLVQNAAQERDWRAAVHDARLPTVRGAALTDEDRLRGEIIERLMCDFRVDLAAVRARGRRDMDWLADNEVALANLERDGVIDHTGDTIEVTDVGRPFVRQVCAAFDAYLDPAALRHSKTI